MTIFSRIIAGEIPCTKVYEDNLCIAILDINPVQKGHTLVIPKQEIEWFHQLPVPLMHHCMEICQRIMQSMITNIPCDFVKLSIVGEEVPHCHIHLVPKLLQPGKDQTLRPKVEYGEGEMQTIAMHIGAGL